MSNNDFHSLLSVFRDATSSSRSVNPNNGSATAKSSGGDDQQHVTGICHANTAQKAPLKSSMDTGSNEVEPTSTTDPSFSAPILKERIERILRIQQIRRSTSSNKVENGCSKKSVHIAICATIVDEFPHEALWKKWMEETGGEFTVDDDVLKTTSAVTGEKSNEDGGGKQDGKEAKSIKSESNKIMVTAELYAHAKNPERVGSEWLRSKTLPISHRPNWNDVRIVRAMLSLLEAALRDEQTTHVLLCTESCIPVATLKETARSILLDEICHWEETKDGNSRDNQKAQQRHNKQRLNWNRSYVDCYDRNSSRCTRFDEHNCWDILRNSVPRETVYKALPGWCLLSRKHAQSILNIPVQLEGLNLWPAFERVWAPEEVFIPTALALGGHMDEVSRRSLTHSQWDERAANHKDRAHPLSYDGCFDDKIVARVRRDGCLFLRKMKRSLDVSIWEQIVVQHRRGQDTGRPIMQSEQEMGKGRDGEGERGRGRGLNERDGHRYDDRHRGERNGSHYSRTGNDSRRNYDSRRPENDHHRHKRERDDHSSYDNSRRRQRGRR
mmetsp:Transcript_32990/g.69426  ORF Transcript_32990/g.69426 Transcript_32990/m.69426 type:complete len:554 (-) Transcript_32990:32-1693(-)